jgi:hypothetical protein
MNRRRGLSLLALCSLMGTLLIASPAVSRTADTNLTNGSPAGLFPRNKQNEPSVAIAVDPSSPNLAVAGSNDEIDLEPCPKEAPTNDIRCPFTAGVGVSGVYFSFDRGRSWKQPTYRGWTARSGTPHVGPIGTLPHYYQAGLVSDGDPSVAFGPRPGPHGFSWSNGSRLYYANLTSNFPGATTFNAQEAIAVSRTDDARAAASGDDNAWKRPVIVSRQLTANIFSDKENIWADNAASSKFFGNVYACWTRFVEPKENISPIVIARSTDGGDTWSNPLKLSRAAATFFTGVQGCTIRTDSRGIVYVFWTDWLTARKGFQMVARSFDGGRTFTNAERVAPFVEVGKVDPVTGGFTFDGVAGARTWSASSASIANGAPSGRDATDEIVLTWPDGRRGLNREQALVVFSKSRGERWSSPVSASPRTDRPDFPAVGISPNGRHLYVTYDAFLTPWRETTKRSRLMQGVVRHSTVHSSGVFGAFRTLHRGAIGDARASSTNSLGAEFLGDYNYVAATNNYALAVWNDVRNAVVCSAINRFRQSLLTNNPLTAPWPLGACPTRFGNTDIYGGPFTP